MSERPALPIQVFCLGRQPYLPVWEAMRALTDGRDAETRDQCWVVEHEPVFTQGQAGKPEHLLMPGDIPVVQTDRGGQVTYHGPGQLVVYPLLDVRRSKLGVRELVTALEQAVVGALGDLGVTAAARADAPGVYVGEAKIASLGLRIRRGASFHGVALNVDMDLGPFARINPCGYAGMAMTRISDLVAATPDSDSVARSLVGHLGRQLGRELDWAAPGELPEHCQRQQGLSLPS
ncbi:lipoyl(octanoyl) transferase LipB [Halomonas sp. ML-15]|uniref:lipoyl(octanoyl) transferase LipB n=1 Tax=Halomonas sp. ML-15 TaxID=2773305 RepID=UPI0017476A68|nr:lipoyl(octanoyl) transferase LipB [Halomonas sp. ML-15]MBD3898598.1 lipoyl(octanoyl) transferase LipB [Halomonas sp. ML-15]